MVDSKMTITIRSYIFTIRL